MEELYAQGEVMYKEGQKADRVIIVKSGEFLTSRKMKTRIRYNRS